MPTTGALWSSGGDFADWDGAPDNVTEYWAVGDGPISGFGVQAAIGSAPTSLDSMTVTIVCKRATGQTFRLRAGATTLQTTTLTNSTTAVSSVTYTIATVPSWAQMANLTVDFPQATNAFHVILDAVGVTVSYTTTIPRSGTVAQRAALSGSAVGIFGEQRSGTIRAGATLSGSATAHHYTGGMVAQRATLTASAYRLALPTGTISQPARDIDTILAAGDPRRTDAAVLLSGPYAGESLPILDWSVSVDETADVRRTGSLMLAFDAWVMDALDPAAKAEVELSITIVDDHNAPHAWSVGIFHATEVRVVEDAAGPSLDAQIADRADWAKLAGMRDREVLSGSRTIIDGVRRLLDARYPGLPTDLDDPGWRAGRDMVVGKLGDDPWRHAVALARSVDRDLRVDPDGVARCPRPADSVTPAVAWVEGAGCVLSRLEVTLSDRDLVNVLGVEWEEARPESPADDWVPAGGIAYAVDDVSPVGVQTAIGERVRSYGGDTSVITTAAHAAEVAAGALLLMQGARLPLAASVLLDPRRDVGDVVSVRRPSLDVNDLYRITALELGSGPLMGVTLARRWVNE